MGSQIITCDHFSLQQKRLIKQHDPTEHLKARLNPDLWSGSWSKWEFFFRTRLFFFFFFLCLVPFFFFSSLQRSVVSVVELLSAEASSLGELASLCNTWKNNDVHDTHVKDKKTKHIKLAGGRHKRSGRCQNAHPKKKKKKNRAQGFNAASRLVAVIKKKKIAHMLHVPVHPLHPPPQTTIAHIHLSIPPFGTLTAPDGQV